MDRDGDVQSGHSASHSQPALVEKCGTQEVRYWISDLAEAAEKAAQYGITSSYTKFLYHHCTEKKIQVKI